MTLDLETFTGGYMAGESSRATVFDMYVAAALRSGKTPEAAVEAASQAIDARRRHFARCEHIAKNGGDVDRRESERNENLTDAEYWQKVYAAREEALAAGVVEPVAAP